MAQRDARLLILVASALCWTAASVGAQEPPLPGAPLTLEAAIERGMRANPAVEAARQRRLVAVQGVAVARERPNPEVRVEFERETPTQAYSFAMPVETGGKRGRRIALGEASAGVIEAEMARTVFDVRTAVRRAYFEVVAAEARLALLLELQELAGRARDAAQERFDAGGAPRLEVLQAELARADAENQATAVKGAGAAAAAQLNALLALPADTGVSLATPIDAGISAAVAQAAGRADAASAEIAVFDRLLAEQRARIALAAAMRVPDVTPEATITRGAEPEFTTGWRAGVGIAIPVFTRHRASVRLEEVTLAALTAERKAALARIAGDVAAAGAIATAAGQQYLRYQSTIVPQAIEIERLAEDSYRLGRTGIAAYLQALQSSRDVRLRMLQAASDYQSALADLERATGAPLP